MSDIEKTEILKQRQRLKKSANKVTELKIGDKRISSTSRICAVCGKRLSEMNRVNGKARVSKNHYHLFFSDLIQSDMCMSSKDCISYLDKKERNE